MATIRNTCEHFIWRRERIRRAGIEMKQARVIQEFHDRALSKEKEALAAKEEDWRIHHVEHAQNMVPPLNETLFKYILQSRKFCDAFGGYRGNVW